MKKRIIFVFFSLIFAVYMIFFPDNLHRELMLVPSWVTPLKNPSGKSVDGSIPFSFDGSLGYFTKSGQLLYTEKMYDGAAMMPEFFINYSRNSDQLILQQPDGKIHQVIGSAGTPFVINGRFFVFTGDQTGIEEYNAEGELIRSITTGSIITSVDAGTETLSLALLNGEIRIYADNEKDPVFSYYSTDSRYSVAYACALTEDGKRFAAVTGLYPQQLICFEYRNDNYVPVFRKTIEDDYRRTVILNYSEDGRFLYMENPEGLDLYSTATFLGKKIELNGSISDIYIPGSENLSFFITSAEEKNIMKIYSTEFGSVASFEFPGGEFYFNPDEDFLFIGVSGRLLRYDIIEG